MKPLYESDSFLILREVPRSQQKKQLYRFILAHSDITAALFFTRELLSKAANMGHPMYSPLLNAIVISYCRPFTDNYEIGTLPSKWATFTDSKLQRTHDELIEMRHTMVAHSDLKAKRVHITPPGMEIAKGHAPTEALGYMIGTMQFAPNKFHDIHNTCSDLGKRLQDAVNELLDNLYQNMTLPNKTFPLRFDEGL